MRARAGIILFLLLAGVTPAVRAQTAPPSTQATPPPSQQAPGGENLLEAPTPPVAPDAPVLTLQEAIRRAIERNPNMSGAELDVVLARLELDRARLDRFSVSVDVSAGDSTIIGWQKQTGTVGLDPFTNSFDYGVTAAASIPLYTGGLVRSRIARSQVDVWISEVDRLLTRRDLALSVLDAYWTIQGFDLQRAATEESLKQSREAVAIIEARLRTGLAAPIEFNRFQVDVLSQEQRLAELENQAYAARQNLLQLLHLSGEQVALTDRAGDVKMREWPERVEALLERSHQQRPELRSIDLAIEGSRHDRQAARSAYLPTVSLDLLAQAGGEGQFISGQPFDGEAASPGAWLQGGVNLQWNLFNLWRTAYNVRRVDIAVDRLKLQRQSQIDAIDAQVKGDWQQLQTLKRRAPGVQRQLELARDNLTIIQTLYGQGSASLLDLFDAQSAYRSALSQEATHRIDLARAEYRLRWVVGDALD